MTTIYDYAGRPIVRPKRPDKDRLPQPRRMDRYAGYMSGTVTPTRVARILRDAESGRITDQANLFDRMLERDARLRGLMQSRCNAIRGLEWQIEPAEDSPADEKIADFCRNALRQCRYFRAGLGRLNRAIGHGFAALELYWEYDGARHIIGQVQEIRQRRFIQDPETREIRLLTETDWLGEAMPPFRAAVHRSDALSANVADSALFRNLVWLWMFKHYALKDFAIFAEVYGMPLRLGRYDPSASPAEIDALKDALQALGTDAAGVISKQCEVTFEEVSAKSGKLPQQELISLVNTEMAIAVLGQTLTTDAGDKGTQALGTVHDQVRMDLVEGDAIALEDTIQNEILRPLVGFNFGWEAEIPSFRLPVPRPKDTEAIARTIQIAVQTGIQVGQRYGREALDIPEPEEDEELVTQPGQAFPAGLKHTATVKRRLDPTPNDSEPKLNVEREVSRYVDNGLRAIEPWIERAQEMIRTDDWRITFEDIQALGRVVQECIERAESMGRGAAISTMAVKERSAMAVKKHSASAGETYEFIPEAAAQMARVKAVTVATVTDVELLDSIKDRLQEAIEEGQTRKWFTGQVNETFDALGMSRLKPRHLNTVFQNNYLTAHAAGRWHALHASPELDEQFPAFQYLTAGDDAVRPEHRAMHGRVYPRGHSVWQTWWPPNGHNCFPGWTKVLTPSGWQGITEIIPNDRVIGGSGKEQCVEAVHRNRFNSDLIRLVFEGGRIESTPNHRILTMRGWVRADALHPGDILVEVVPLPTVNTRIDDIDRADTQFANRGVPFPIEGEPAASLTTDSDVYLRDIDIKPAGAQGGGHDVIMNRLNPQTGDMFEHHCLSPGRGLSAGGMGRRVSSHIQAMRRGISFANFRAAGRSLCLQGLSDSANAVIRIFRLAQMGLSTFGLQPCSSGPHALGGICMPFGRGVQPLGADGISAAAGFDFKIRHEPHQSADINMPARTDLPIGELISDIEPLEGLEDWDFLDAFDSLDRFRAWARSHAVLRELKGVSRLPYNGIVYNLSVTEDRSYIVQGATVHNCRCRVSPVSKYEIEDGEVSVQTESRPIDLSTGRVLQPDPGWTGNAAVDNRSFREWAMRTIPLDKTPEYYRLTAWKDVDGDPAPALVSPKNKKHFRKIYESVFNVDDSGIGRVKNMAGETVLIKDAFWYHLNQKEMARRRRIKNIPAVLAEPQEVWSVIDKDKFREHYITKFISRSGGETSSFVAVTVENGELSATTFVPISEARKVENLRRGVLVWARK